MSADSYVPRPEHKFSFGLWTVANRGRDPFGSEVRPVLPPVDAVKLLGDVGAWGVNLHDNDLVPIDATPAERDRIVKEFKQACDTHGIVVPMATVSLFFDPAFRDGAFTANDPAVRAYAIQKTMRAMDIGAELGAKIFVLWGGREGTETDACRRPDEAVKRLRYAVDYLCEYSIDRKYGYKFAMEAKPNEPRGDIYMATTGNYLGLIPDAGSPGHGRREPRGGARADGGAQLHPCGRAGVGSREALPHRPERPGAGPLRSGLPLRRGEPQVGVLPGEVPRGCGLRRPAALRRARVPHRELRRREGLRPRLHADVPDPEGEGRALEQGRRDPGDCEVDSRGQHATPEAAKFSPAHAATLLGHTFDRATLAAKVLPYEKLDQLTVEILTGVR
jgi:xylose isomerase